MMHSQPPPLRLLAISGSLRAASSNSTLLRAAGVLALQHTEVEFYLGLGERPHFNPDLDGEALPLQVADLRAQIAQADAMLSCSPSTRTACRARSRTRWTGWCRAASAWVSMGKPTGLLNASFASTHAHAALSETLGVMMARLSPQTSVRVPLTTNRISQASILADSRLCAILREVLVALAAAASEPPGSGASAATGCQSAAEGTPSLML